MESEKLAAQVEAVDRAFHQIWFSIMFDRHEYASENVQKMSFIEMHLIGLAYERPDMIIKELRHYLKVPQTTLSSIIAKLERQGYIRRVINPRDMRSFSLEVTEKGREIRELHSRNDLRQAREALLALAEDERDLFIRLIQKVGKAFSSGQGPQYLSRR